MAIFKKILLLLSLFLVFSLLGSFKVFIPVLFVIVFVVFPGSGVKPWLVRLAPWLWGLSFVLALILVLFQNLSSQGLPQELTEVSKTELWGTLIFVPFLLWGYIRENKPFLWILWVSFAFSITTESINYWSESVELEKLLTLVSFTLADFIFTYYLFRYFLAASKKAQN